MPLNKLIIVSGATGLIGSKLSKRLVDLGYDIVSLTRNVEKSKSVVPWSKYHLSYTQLEQIGELIPKSLAIINLAGAPIAGKRWTKKYKEEILNSRTQTTKLLVSLINKSHRKPHLLINTSAIGYYGNTNDTIIDEASPNGNGFLADVTKQWEQETKCISPETNLIIARLGVVLDSEGGALKKMLLPFKFYVGGAIGTGKQWMSWIHIADLIDMFVWCIENNLSGTINFTSPNPTKMIDFSKTLGNILHRPSIFRMPAFALNLLLGEASTMITDSCKVLPKIALEKGYKFNYPTIKCALSQLIKSL